MDEDNFELKIIPELEQLAKLRKFNVITEEEYGVRKAALLKPVTKDKAGFLSKGWVVASILFIVLIIFVLGRNGSSVDSSSPELATSVLPAQTSNDEAPEQLDFRPDDEALGEVATASELSCNESLKVPAFGNILYSDARPDLLAAGWKPLHTAPSDVEYNGCSASFMRRFPEAQACSGTGLGFKSFYWIDPKSDEFLQVTTRGEGETEFETGVNHIERGCGVPGSM